MGLRKAGESEGKGSETFRNRTERAVGEGCAAAAAGSKNASEIEDDSASVLSQDPEPGAQALAQQRVGTRPVDQDTHPRKPQSASAPASRPLRVMKQVTEGTTANSENVARRVVMADPRSPASSRS